MRLSKSVTFIEKYSDHYDFKLKNKSKNFFFWFFLQRTIFEYKILSKNNRRFPAYHHTFLMIWLFFRHNTIFRSSTCSVWKHSTTRNIDSSDHSRNTRCGSKICLYAHVAASSHSWKINGQFTYLLIYFSSRCFITTNSKCHQKFCQFYTGFYSSLQCNQRLLQLQ